MEASISDKSAPSPLYLEQRASQPDSGWQRQASSLGLDRSARRRIRQTGPPIRPRD